MTIFAILQLMDILTTLAFLRLGVHEGNATMAWLMIRIGIVPALFLTKAVMIGASSALTPRAQSWMNKFYFAVVVWNLLVIGLAGLR